ncbi:MAG: DUF1499 domain-containing protein [Syntrophaceae bacterium]|nr:DUF1499 domain-containing protein [Syntrophaceae bacterium]
MLKPLILLLAGFCFAGCSGARPDGLGLKAGRLAPCPSSPNCISSQAPREDRTHFAEPFRYAGSAEDARRRLLDVLKALPRVRIVVAEERYIRAEFTSTVFRFVDDVEFVFDDAEKAVHVRSASRVGYSDLGVNRKRVEAIRRAFREASGEKS